MNIANLFASLGFKVDESPLERINEKLEGVKSRLEFLGAAEVIRGVYELTESYSHFSEELGTAATAAGLTVEALQKIQYAAGLAGVSSEEVASGLTRITRAVYEARNGNQQAIDQFAAAGIKPAQIASFRTGKEALLALSDSIRGIEDPIKKQAILVELLGRGSRNMVEFLGGGREEIEKFGESAEDAGAIISTKSITALREMEDSLSTFWRIAKAFAATLAASVAPAITAAANSFGAFYAANRKVIELQIKGWVDVSLAAFGYLTGVILGITKDFLSFAEAHPVLVRNVGFAVEALGGLALALIVGGRLLGLLSEAWGVLKLAMNGMEAPFKLVSGGFDLIKKAIGWILIRIGYAISTAFPALGEAIFGVGEAILATPIGWAVAGIATLVLGIQALWAVMHGGKLEDTWLGKLIAKAKDAGKSVLDFFGFGGGEQAQTAKDQPQGKMAEMMGLAQPAKGDKFDRYIDDIEAAQNKLADLRLRSGQQPPAALAKALPATGAGAAPVNISSQLTINLPPGTPADAMKTEIAKQVQDHHNEVLRQTAQSLAGVQTQ